MPDWQFDHPDSGRRNILENSGGQKRSDPRRVAIAGRYGGLPNQENCMPTARAAFRRIPVSLALASPTHLAYWLVR